MFGWISCLPSWLDWDTVQGITSVIGMGTVAAAVVAWFQRRRTAMDACLDVTRLAHWTMDRDDGTVSSGETLRIQNVGSVGIAIHMLYLKGGTLNNDRITDPRDMFTNAIMPGECCYVDTTRLSERAELIVQYMTHRNVNAMRFDRFDLDRPKPETWRLDERVRPSRKDRKAMRYKGGLLFGNEGVTCFHRTCSAKAYRKRYGGQIMKQISEHGFTALTVGLHLPTGRKDV